MRDCLNVRYVYIFISAIDQTLYISVRVVHIAEQAYFDRTTDVIWYVKLFSNCLKINEGKKIHKYEVCEMISSLLFSLFQIQVSYPIVICSVYCGIIVLAQFLWYLWEALPTYKQTNIKTVFFIFSETENRRI